MTRVTRLIPIILIAAALQACALFSSPRPPQPPAPTPTPTVTPTPTPAPMTFDQAMVLINAAYRDLLNRQPDPTGIAEYSTRLCNEGWDDARMRAHIQASAEYKALHAPAPTPTPRPIEVIDGKLPPAVFNTIRQFTGTFALPRDALAKDGEASSERWQDEALRYGWIKRLAEQLAHDYGPAWGQKRRGPGSPVSAGSIAMQAPGGMHVWDLLIGAASGKPSLASDPEHFWVTDQEWLPVTPTDHFATVVRTTRAKLPTPIWGVSAFDMAARVAAGDFRYYNLIDGLVPNVFAYATINYPGRVYRDFPTGIRQVERLLEKLAADGRQAHFIMLCGTGNDGTSREQALDMVRQFNALFLRYPSAVIGVSLGNELFQGFEAPYMLDPAFWRDAEGLIDRRFPFAVGQVSEVVNVWSGQSFAVHHSDRGLDPDSATAILAEAQNRSGIAVIDREPRRIEQGGQGQATGDLDFVRGLIAAAHKYGISTFLHPAAGRGADVDALDDVQRAAIELYKAEAKRVRTPEPEEEEWPIAA